MFIYVYFRFLLKRRKKMNLISTKTTIAAKNMGSNNNKIRQMKLNIKET